MMVKTKCLFSIFQKESKKTVSPFVFSQMKGSSLKHIHLTENPQDNLSNKRFSWSSKYRIQEKKRINPFASALNHMFLLWYFFKIENSIFFNIFSYLIFWGQQHRICFMTSSQINDTFLFHRVIKILTGGRILQISIAWCQIDREIHSIPTMYGKGG